MPASSEAPQPRLDRRTRGGGRGRSNGPTRGGGGRREWVPRVPTGPILPNPAAEQGQGGHFPNPSRGRPRRRPVQPSPVRPSSVEAAAAVDPSVPQLVQEIQEKLARGGVECMICCEAVRRSAPVWSCSSCYSIFHLSCIKKWARSPTSTDSSAADSNRNWRCPGCQSVQQTSAKDIQYFCFCGQRKDPPNDLYLTPHSCGEPCGRPLDRSGDENADGEVLLMCPHLCVLQCHPGPCPPCKAFAPRRMCPCGKQSVVRRCSDRKTPLTCGETCGRMLLCGRHRCERVCHVGPCGSCGVAMSAVCFCGKKMEMVLCGEMAVKGEVKSVDGIFSCGLVCGKSLGCGNHVCSENCHPGPCGECEFLPQKVRTCYCGKTELKQKRSTCLDPIPTCSQICGKLLFCGKHRCKDKCHEGECGPCLVPVNQKCRCGSSSRMVECYKTLDDGDKFLCEKPCGRKKNCGRHRCNELCCPLYSGNFSNFHGDWDPHLCQMPCEKKLRCGQHSCQSLCHSGHCPPCLETIFTDLSCACGKTALPPPLPCGTPFPSCPHPCLVTQPCGHSASHTCHFGDCPPCPVPVSKECVGGHVVLRNIPCGSKDIRCNQLCGRTRQCGMHACARTCHPSPCDASCEYGPNTSSSVKSSCGQTCGAPRRDCRHTCKEICHPSAPCPDTRCEFTVTITCSCGRIAANVPCGAGGGAGGFSTDTVFEATIIHKLPAPLQAVEANEKRIPLGQRKLVCDEECAKLERKRVLADAFDITPPNLDALHFGENPSLSDVLTDLLRREPKWVMALEERFKFLVLGKSKGSFARNSRVHVFCHMTKEKRDVLRQMAERWKLAVCITGWEPKRFLAVYVTTKSKAPARILGTKPGHLILGAPPVFDPLVDMDPRLVVSFLDLPRDADISALVLRFGGECELVWLNDKNAVAVFSDPARAATALRRIDHGSAYHGISLLPPNTGVSKSSGNNAWGGGSKEVLGSSSTASKSSNPWKKLVSSDSTSWGETGLGTPTWKVDDAPIPASMNQWSVLQLNAMSSVAVSDQVIGGDEYNSDSTPKEGSSSAVQGSSSGEPIANEEVDDWEKLTESV